MFLNRVNKEIHLELLDEHHIAPLFDLVTKNKEYLSLWLKWAEKISTPLDIKYFIRDHKNRWVNNEGFDCGIFYNNSLCGVIGFHEIDHQHKSVSIGYWLDESYQGKNIVTRCVQRFIEIAVINYDIQKIYIQCAIHNLKSQSIPIRLGFTEEKIISDAEYIKGKHIDHKRYIFKTKKHP